MNVLSKVIALVAAVAAVQVSSLAFPGEASAIFPTKTLAAGAPKSTSGADYTAPLDFAALRTYTQDNSAAYGPNVLYYAYDYAETERVDTSGSAASYDLTMFNLLASVGDNAINVESLNNSGGLLQIAQGSYFTNNGNYSQTVDSNLNVGGLLIELGSDTKFGTIGNLRSQNTKALLTASNIGFGGFLSFVTAPGFDLATQSGQSFFLFDSPGTITGSIFDVSRIHPQGIHGYGDFTLGSFNGIVHFESLAGLNGGQEVWGTIAPVPEPSTIVLLGVGLAGLAGLGIRRRNKK